MEALRNYMRQTKEDRGIAYAFLRPLFGALPLELRLHLANESMLEMIAASLAAKDRWGNAGNVRIGGNTIRVGVDRGEEFEEMGRGKSAAEAFMDADRRR